MMRIGIKEGSIMMTWALEFQVFGSFLGMTLLLVLILNFLIMLEIMQKVKVLGKINI